MKKVMFLILVLLPNMLSKAQNKKVLFLGNSYTYYNNLPELLVNISQSTNDLIAVDSYMPGGYTLKGHNANNTSLAKINQGNWDFVVLQEQSQLPSYPIDQVNTQVFPFAKSLNDKIVAQNPCAETVFYMTWGRENGDSENCNSNPPVCNFIGMNDLLQERYLTMTNDNSAIVSPVSVVWKYLRANYPSMNLYDPDGSHPSILGSYVAACCFYTVILRKNPTLITFNSTLSLTDANIIKTATKNLVFDNLLTWKVGSYDPKSIFTINNTTTNTVSFTNSSTNANQFLWEFGDNLTSNEINPTHTYANLGEFVVKLTATKCGKNAVYQKKINTTVLSYDQHLNFENKIKVHPNPVKDELFIDSQVKIKSIEILDIFGRLLENCRNIDSKISFANKNSGIYFLKIQTENGMVNKKIIKE